ncbi:beta-ketoacyl-[acyl-carrier-protein] synthase family protein [Streptomyces sp. NPDC059788]|uniref:beta-ketoacyl-[acyl-carrier-protein] synthase family protein n=1 Tax=Streptomyces sp. NPDC059788 TaxID=3346948 RepID=UPI0036612631
MVNVPVVVTGMAWTTPLGDGLDDVWRLLCAGATGVVPVDSPHRVRTPLAAPVPSAPYGSATPEERQIALATRTLTAAFSDAGLAADDPRVTLVLGTSFGGQLDAEQEPERHWTREVADRLGHPGAPLCVTTACSAGADSLLVAEALIRGGHARICVAGGADVLSEAKRLGHTALGTMSPTGLRAFDAAHDGLVLGEGAGFLVLEARETARARGARVHARLDGAGSANDAAGLTVPDPTGDSVVAAVRRCAGGIEDIGVVCAHGTGTPVNDEVESATLRRLFADARRSPVVFGTKGALGHSLGATGAIEAIATVQALRHRATPPVAGLETPMPGFPLRLSDGTAPDVSGRAGLSLTLGFGGFNTCLRFSYGEVGDAGEEAAGEGPDGPGPGRTTSIGHGAVTVDDPATCSANRPSFYADPVAWLVTAAVEAALDESGRREEVLAARNAVGVVVLTGTRPLPTSRLLAAQAADGRTSPLRFAGANPGILAGLTCIRWGLRGPSLVLAAAEDSAVDAALTVADAWLRSGHTRYVIGVRHQVRADGRHTAACAVLGASAEPGADPRAFLTAPGTSVTTPA